MTDSTATKEQTKIHHSWDAVTRWVFSIAGQMQDTNWKPDYIVGISRGGLVPAVMLSHYFGVPLSTVHIAFRDHPGLGAITPTISSETKSKILVVDEINASGDTLTYIDDNLADVGLANADVKYAVLLDKTSSSFDGVDYLGRVVFNNTEWHVFPWEVL